MRRLLRWIIVLGVLGGLGAAVTTPLAAWWHKRNVPRFLTATMTRGRVESVVNSTGTIKPVKSVTVAAFVSGPIAEIFVDFNSKVKKGMVMAKIDPRLWGATVERDRATLATMKAELARVEALLQQAKNNEERAQKLLAVNKDYLSDTEFDQYKFSRKTFEAQRELALASITQAEATLKNSQANLDYTDIRAPVDAIVTDRKVDPGQTVAASFQTPELFILAPDMEKHMHVYASVDEADIGLISAARDRGEAVKFTVDAYPGDLFEGKVYQIRMSSTTTQNVVTYPVIIEAPNPNLKLMPGMTANISFRIESKENVLRVPAAALRYVPNSAHVRPEQIPLDGLAQPTDTPSQRSASEKVEMAKSRQRRLIWIQDGELLKAVPVVLGIIENQFAEVIEGDLTDGQTVVTGLDTSPAK